MSDGIHLPPQYRSPAPLRTAGNSGSAPAASNESPTRSNGPRLPGASFSSSPSPGVERPLPQLPPGAISSANPGPPWQQPIHVEAVPVAHVTAVPSVLVTPNEPVGQPSRPLSAASSDAEGISSGSSRVAQPAQTTPRKRFQVKSPRSPGRYSYAPSPRRRLRPTAEKPERTARPSIITTLEYVLLPLRVVLAPLQVILGPAMWHLVNALVLVTILGATLYITTTYIRGMFASVFGFGAPSASIPNSVAMLPVRALATPACLLGGLGCQLSFLAPPNGTAHPIWRVFTPGNDINVAAVSHELSKEVRSAKDIFESLQALGDGRMTQGLGHVRIYELGIAIQTGSSLDDRFFIGQDLIELANLASDLTDEVIMINAMSVNTFSWLFWEFSHLTQLLSLPPSQRPSTDKLGPRLDSLINRLDRELDRLYLNVEAAIPIAARGSEKGWSLLQQLSDVRQGLSEELERFPGWQRALDVSKRFFTGGDPSKLTRISRDLDITRGTITGISDTQKSLGRLAVDLKAFRTQLRAFKGSVMGLHLGADEHIGLGPEQEIGILSGVVDELGSAVGRAKRRPIDADRGIEGGDSDQ